MTPGKDAFHLVPIGFQRLPVRRLSLTPCFSKGTRLARSADIPVRSNGLYGERDTNRPRLAFGSCCGQECPRSAKHRYSARWPASSPDHFKRCNGFSLPSHCFILNSEISDHQSVGPSPFFPDFPCLPSPISRFPFPVSPHNSLTPRAVPLLLRTETS